MLGVTSKGHKFMRGYEKIMVKAMGDLSQQVKFAAVTPSFVSGSPAVEDRSELYSVLAKERLLIAKSTNLPAYIICHNKTLLQLAQTRPTTKKNLAKVFGFSTNKIENYGKQFLAAIVKYSRENSLETDQFPKSSILKQRIACTVVEKKTKQTFFQIAVASQDRVRALKENNSGDNPDSNIQCKVAQVRAPPPSMPVWFPAVKRKEQEDRMTGVAKTEMVKKMKANPHF